MTIQGPDDARCIVWALGEYFLVLFDTNSIFIVYLQVLILKYRVGIDDEKGPKRLQTRRLGQVSLFYFSFATNKHFLYTQVLLSK